MRLLHLTVVIAAVGVIAARPAAPLNESSVADRTTWDSVFTPEQAARGQTAYAATCARCHQESLSGADESPALAGGTFLSKWSGLTLGDLHDRVRVTMPPSDPGTYGRQHISDVLAYVLSVNGFPAGRAELPVAGAALQVIRIEAARR